MCFFNTGIRMVDNCNTKDTHKDSNYMDTHTDSYKDNKAGTTHYQGSYLLNLLKTDPLAQIRIHHAVGNFCHNFDAYYQTVPSISPFLTYPIRDGLSEEGRTPIGHINNNLAHIQITTITR